MICPSGEMTSAACGGQEEFNPVPIVKRLREFFDDGFVAGDLQIPVSQAQPGQQIGQVRAIIEREGYAPPGLGGQPLAQDAVKPNLYLHGTDCTAPQGHAPTYFSFQGTTATPYVQDVRPDRGSKAYSISCLKFIIALSIR